MGRFYIFVLLFLSNTTAAWAKDFCVVPYPPYEPGFFSVFNSVLGALELYYRKEISGLRVDFGTQGWYYESHRGQNWWNYYFEPINMQIPPHTRVRVFERDELGAFSVQSQRSLPLKQAHGLIKKYIRVRPHILQKIEQFCKAHFDGHFIIGVHYRGTDKQGEVELVPHKVALEVIQHAIGQYTALGYQVRIFLATDDLSFFTFLKAHLSTALIYLHTFRSTTAQGTHKEAKFAPYQKGEDALMDCILLSRCNLLIKTASNLSDCSRQFNPDLPVIHLSKTPGDQH